MAKIIMAKKLWQKNYGKIFTKKNVQQKIVAKSYEKILLHKIKAKYCSKPNYRKKLWKKYSRMFW